MLRKFKKTNLEKSVFLLEENEFIKFTSINKLIFLILKFCNNLEEILKIFQT